MMAWVWLHISTNMNWGRLEDEEDVVNGDVRKAQQLPM